MQNFRVALLSFRKNLIPGKPATKHSKTQQEETEFSFSFSLPSFLPAPAQ